MFVFFPFCFFLLPTNYTAGNLVEVIDNLSGLRSLTELNLRRNQIEKVLDLDTLPNLQVSEEEEEKKSEERERREKREREERRERERREKRERERELLLLL